MKVNFVQKIITSFNFLVTEFYYSPPEKLTKEGIIYVSPEEGIVRGEIIDKIQYLNTYNKRKIEIYYGGGHTLELVVNLYYKRHAYDSHRISTFPLDKQDIELKFIDKCAKEAKKYLKKILVKR